ncbi:D-cysteine desulfhydrase [compost metagenome]
MGGNKLRKLEFLIGDALKNGCDTIITTGGLQSNHARITAAAAAKAGLACELMLSTLVPNETQAYQSNGNQLLKGYGHVGHGARTCPGVATPGA